MKFSIIVPVYNMEQYLARCLDSILSQDYTDFEIICVNDGSKDNSLRILRDYAQKDNRIIIVDKLNGGLGPARNSGLERAGGDYVWFVDSDDWIEKGSLSTLSRIIEGSGFLNAYIIDMIDTDDKTYQRVVNSCSRGSGEESSIRYAKDLLLYNALFFAQNKIYKYDFIKGYHFRTGFYEDIPQIVLFGEKEFGVYIAHEALYYYYSRPGSIMKTVDKRVLDIFSQNDVVYDGIYDNKVFQPYCTHMFYYSMARTYKRIKQSAQKDLQFDFTVRFKERKKRYLSPWSLLFFKDITLRRKMMLLNSFKNYCFL